MWTKKDGNSEPTKAQQNMEAIDGWLDKLATETDQARLSANLNDYLRSVARFHKYSFGNQLLIAIQRPAATRVASFKAWQGLGRQVKKGEHGISILVPYFRKVKDAQTGQEDSLLTGFGTGHVFDISQTEGADLPGLTRASVDGNHDRTFDTLVKACTSRNIKVVIEALQPGVYGYSAIGKIALTDAQTKTDNLPVLIHEIAHELLHKEKERATYTTRQKECQAEATAYAVCAHLGIDYPNSGTYLALYGISREQLRANLEAIRVATKTIIDWLESETKDEVAA